MKRATGILILLTALWAISPRSESATLYQIVKDQLIAKYGLDTALCKVEVVSSHLLDESVASDRVRIQPLFQNEPVGPVSVVAEVTDADNTVRRGQISLRVQRFADVLVASTNIKLHEELNSGKLIKRLADVTSLREQAVTSPDSIAGYRTRRNLAEGQIVTREAVEPMPDIEVGHEIAIQYKKNSFVISTRGQAMQTGWFGQLVRVRNLASGKVIVAQVSGENEVTIKL